jgi:hypothetical protein
MVRFLIVSEENEDNKCRNGGEEMIATINVPHLYRIYLFFPVL